MGSIVVGPQSRVDDKHGVNNSPINEKSMDISNWNTFFRLSN